MIAKRLILMQGCSGSGKSFVATCLMQKYSMDNIACEYCSADSFFINDGKYEFDSNRLGVAHDYCKNKAKRAMQNNYDVVIIDNTNTRQKEAQPYIDMAKEYGYFVSIISVSADDSLIDKQNKSRKSDRQIPKAVIEKQKNRTQLIKI